MKLEHNEILDCLKHHPLSCVALKPTALIPVEKIKILNELLENENYNQINLDSILQNSEIEKIAAPFIDLTKKASEVGTKILIDAEQSNLQPGVDLLSLFLMRHFNNKASSIVYNTYQLYLKDSQLRISVHKDWLESNNSKFAAKLVRGAYLSYESAEKTKSHPNYVMFDSKSLVDQNYNSTVRNLIFDGSSSLIIATHNLESLKLLMCFLEETKFNEIIEYAYLMGIGDKTTIRATNLRCLEYVPYGPSDVKIPYLIRRLEENISIFENKK